MQYSKNNTLRRHTPIYLDSAFLSEARRGSVVGTRNISIYFLSGLILCLLLLSACSSSGSVPGGNTIKAMPTPLVDTAIQHQGTAQLQVFQQWIALMQQYGGDTTTYQQQYNADAQALQNAKTTAAYKTALTALNSHVEAIKLPAMKAETVKLQQQLQQEVASWGQQHQYHNAYDNTNYPLGYEYGPNGIGGWVQDDLNSAQTLADYQQAIENEHMYLDNFQAMTANSTDKTPYNQPHQADLQLIQHYGKTNSKVVIVSLQEQAMRVYDNGKLVNAFLVTTGRPNLPTPPGVWWVEGKQSPTVFKPAPGTPRNSPEWYPDTPINFAMQYHSNGYFLHDSWWRADYGPGTNYPHADASGDIFSAQGSHGCVNLSKENAGWLYNFVQVYTPIIIY
ncbi:MAG TPA: L,D-transpeptidase [Ktedonosporobacter sp.]|nr:L,D-transpeptidase [Ktedonosporobacter sp.]